MPAALGRGAPASTREGRGELAQRPALDLAHALAADPEAVAQLAQGGLLALQAVARAQDLPLARGEAGQQRVQLANLDDGQDALVLVLRQRIARSSPKAPTSPSAPATGSSSERGGPSVASRSSTWSAVRPARSASSARLGSRPEA